MKPWSFSSMNVFNTCGRQYDLTYNQKVIKFVETEENKWGNEVHKALENYAKGDPLAEKYHPFKAFTDKLLTLQGDLFVEKRVALLPNLTPTHFFDDNAWCRGVIDVGVVFGRRALVADYKTGKVKPDSDQLKLFAGFTFQHYPQVEKVKTAYIWLAHRKVTVETYTRGDLPEIWKHFKNQAARMERAYELNRWTPKPSGLCNGWCGAGKQHCEFWMPKKV